MAMTDTPRFSEGFAEIVLIVADVQAAARFYREVVGLVPETEADDEWAWFYAGVPGASQRLALRRGPLLFEQHSPRDPANRFGAIHYAFCVPRARLDAAVVHVRAAGVAVYGPVRLDWMRADSFYFYDPDGNLLEWWSPDE